MFSRIFFIVIGSVLAVSSSLCDELPAGQGWLAIPNTKIQSVCAGNNGFPQVLGTTGCPAITAAWSGAVFDSRRNRMIVFGGGHNDYFGNELYAINLQSASVERLTDPGLPLAAGCSESVANGTQPNSRHTYDGIEYIESTDEMFVFGGSLACGSGEFGADTWTYDFGAQRWQRRTPSGPTPWGDAGIMTAYDPVTGRVFLHDRQYLYSFDSQSNSYTRLSSSNAGLSYYGAATIDPKRRLFLIFTGSGMFSYSIDTGSSYQMQSFNTSGGNSVVNSAYPGVVYDPLTDRVVGWSQASGDSVYSLNVDTRQWSQISYSGGPRAVGNGTHGRFQYSAASGVFVLANRVSDDVYILRTSNSAPIVRPNPPSALAAEQEN
jgi:hypothetical protein